MVDGTTVHHDRQGMAVASGLLTSGWIGKKGWGGDNGVYQIFLFCPLNEVWITSSWDGDVMFRLSFPSSGNTLTDTLRDMSPR